jgi:hypothetical protein
MSNPKRDLVFVVNTLTGGNVIVLARHPKGARSYVESLGHQVLRSDSVVQRLPDEMAAHAVNYGRVRRAVREVA